MVRRPSGVSLIFLACLLIVLVAPGPGRAQADAAAAARCTADPATAGGAGLLELAVQDAATGAPVAGALVRWAGVGQAARTASTDAAGRAALLVPINARPGGPARLGQRVGIEVARNGYLAERRELRVCPGANPALAVALAPRRQLATVTGHVTGPDGQGIGGALVGVRFRGFAVPGLSTTTDDQGGYAIPGVGYGDDLAVRVLLPGTAPACTRPAAQPIEVDAPVVTADVAIPLSPALAWGCPPVENGDLTGGAGEESPPTLYTGWPMTLNGEPTGGPPPLTLRRDPSIQWSPVTIDGILVSADRNAWNSGHVNDLLKIGRTEMLVASDTGGVWAVAWSSDSAAALPLSTTWTGVNTNTLAQGPDGPSHAYAGTRNVGGLWETDTAATSPLLQWVYQFVPCSTINHALVIPEQRLIVLACEAGVYWATIPPAPSAGKLYTWKQAQPGPGTTFLAVQQAFSRLAKGPGWTGPAASPGTIVASRWGGTAPGDLIFWGTFVNGDLLLQAATVQPKQGPVSQFIGRTTIAACPADPHVLYAIGDSQPELAGVWRSADGGQAWTRVNLPPNGAPPAATGHQGEYNQALAVSPADCNTFAIGWSYSSFVSFDGGGSYPMALNGAVSNGCLHDDYHALAFDPDDPQTLWFGSDGGVASASGVSPGGTPSFACHYNQHLYDLQFYHASPSRVAGLVAGPLQDNAVAYEVGGNAWQRVPGSSGDGAYTVFTGAGTSDADDLLLWNSPGNAWQGSPWSGSGFGGIGTVPVADTTSPRDGAGIQDAVNWPVRHPSWANAAGQLLYAVAGRGPDVYGLFAQDDGTDAHWEHLGAVGAGENVTAVSSAVGAEVFVGTDQGNICQLTAPYTGTCVDFAVNQSPPSSITGVLELFSTIGMATTASGNALALDGQGWEVRDGALPTDSAFVSVDGPNVGTVFVTNGQGVFVTHDLGLTWLDASQGLPRVAQGNELRYGRQADGTRAMYLSTYGWSMFRADLP